MAMAPVGYYLWQYVLRFDPQDPMSIGMRSFGASAPLKDLQREFGFTVERVVDAAKSQLGQIKT